MSFFTPPPGAKQHTQTIDFSPGLPWNLRLATMPPCSWQPNRPANCRKSKTQDGWDCYSTDYSLFLCHKTPTTDSCYSSSSASAAPRRRSSVWEMRHLLRLTSWKRESAAHESQKSILNTSPSFKQEEAVNNKHSLLVKRNIFGS